VKKYAEKGWIDKAAAADALNTLSAANAKSWAKNSFAGLTREDGSHRPDPEGAVPSSAVDALKAKVPVDDPHRGDKLDALDQEYNAHQRNYAQVGFEQRRDVMTQGLIAGGGKFAIPKDSLDWQKLVRLHGDLATVITDRMDNKNFQAWHRGKMSAHEASREAVGAARYYLDMLSSEDQKLVSKEQLDSIIDRSYSGPGVSAGKEEKDKVLEYLDRLKSGKTDPIERKFGEIATQALNEDYKGNRRDIQTYMNRAHYFLADQYEQSVRDKKPLSETELRKRLVDEFANKGGFLGTSFGAKRAGEKYESKGRVQPNEFETGSDAWKLLPPGTLFRFKADPPGRMRKAP
jgi:hypothetical protein